MGANIDSGPKLGLATTQLLLVELMARGRRTGGADGGLLHRSASKLLMDLAGETLAYRTWSGSKNAERQLRLDVGDSAARALTAELESLTLKYNQACRELTAIKGTLVHQLNLSPEDADVRALEIIEALCVVEVAMATVMRKAGVLMAPEPRTTS